MMLHRIGAVGLSPRRPASGRDACPPLIMHAAAEGATIAAPESKKAHGPLINVIPNNGSSPNGVPAVMGAHLMASGYVAPFSTSKGAGDGPPHQFQYPTVEGDVQVLLHTTPAKAAATLVSLVVEAAAAAIKARGVFTLVLSGGALPEQLAGLAKAKGIAWDKVWVFFVDERNVPHTHPDSNLKLVQDSFLSKVPIPPSQVVSILENVPVDQAARAYEGALLALPTKVLPRTSDAAPLPIFDQVLLGLGPDGHVASLFPNMPQLAPTTGAWVLGVSAAPKPPPQRITMTLAVINAARDVVFAALGDSKAEVVQRVLEVQALPGALPAQMVRPVAGTLRWVLDINSADRLDLAAWSNPSAFPRSQ